MPETAVEPWQEADALACYLELVEMARAGDPRARAFFEKPSPAPPQPRHAGGDASGPGIALGRPSVRHGAPQGLIDDTRQRAPALIARRRGALVGAVLLALGLGIAALILLLASPAAAQMVVTLPVSTTSANAALPALFASPPYVWLFNNGTQEIFIMFGDSSVTATTGAYAFQGGECVAVSVAPAGVTNIAAITSTGTSTLLIRAGAPINPSLLSLPARQGCPWQ